jgi:hypothetical protein
MSDQSRAEVTARGREREREGESARAVHLMGRDWPFDSCLLVQQGGRGASSARANALFDSELEHDGGLIASLQRRGGA